MNAFGPLLRKLRERAGLSRRVAIEHLGRQFTTASIANWENEERTPFPAHLATLLGVYNVSTVEIVEVVEAASRRDPRYAALVAAWRVVGLTDTDARAATFKAWAEICVWSV